MNTDEWTIKTHVDMSGHYTRIIVFNDCGDVLGVLDMTVSGCQGAMDKTLTKFISDKLTNKEKSDARR